MKKNEMPDTHQGLPNSLSIFSSCVSSSESYIFLMLITRPSSNRFALTRWPSRPGALLRKILQLLPITATSTTNLVQKLHRKKKNLMVRVKLQGERESTGVIYWVWQQCCTLWWSKTNISQENSTQLWNAVPYEICLTEATENWKQARGRLEKRR